MNTYTSLKKFNGKKFVIQDMFISKIIAQRFEHT